MRGAWRGREGQHPGGPDYGPSRSGRRQLTPSSRFRNAARNRRGAALTPRWPRPLGGGWPRSPPRPTGVPSPGEIRPWVPFQPKVSPNSFDQRDVMLHHLGFPRQQRQAGHDLSSQRKALGIRVPSGPDPRQNAGVGLDGTWEGRVPNISFPGGIKWTLWAGWLGAFMRQTELWRAGGVFPPLPPAPSLPLAASLCLLLRISCSPLSVARVSSVRRGEWAQDEQGGRDRTPTGGWAGGHRPGAASPQAGRLQAASQTRSHGPPWDAASPGGARQRAPRGHESPVRTGRACAGGPRELRALLEPRGALRPSPAQVLSRPLACRPVVGSAANLSAGVCGRQSRPEAWARRGGERSRSAPGFGVPRSRHLWPPSLRQVVQRTAPRLLGRRPPARSLPHHRHPVPLLAALRALVGPKPLVHRRPQAKLNRPWNRRPPRTSGRPAPTGSLRPAEVELAGRRGLQSPSGGELLSYPHPRRPLSWGVRQHFGSVPDTHDPSGVSRQGPASPPGAPGSSRRPDNVLPRGQPGPQVEDPCSVSCLRVRRSARPPPPAHAPCTLALHTSAHTHLAHPCTHTVFLRPLHTHPTSPPHTPRIPAPRTCTPLHTLGSTPHPPDPAPQETWERLTGGSKGQLRRMRRQDKDAEEGCGSRRFVAGAGRGRGRAPDRGCGCPGDAGWGRGASRSAAAGTRPRVPVRACSASPTCHRHTPTSSHAHTSHMNAYASHTRRLHTLHTHIPHSLALQAGWEVGLGGADRDPGQPPSPGTSRQSGTTWWKVQTCPLAHFGQLGSDTANLGPTRPEGLLLRSQCLNSLGCRLCKDKPVVPGGCCGPGPAQGRL